MRTLVPEIGAPSVDSYTSSGSVEMSEIVGGIGVTALSRSQVPLKGFPQVCGHALASAEADPDGELSFKFSTLSCVQLHLEAPPRVPWNPPSISIRFAECMEGSGVSMIRSLPEPRSCETVVLRDSNAFVVVHANMVLGIGLARLGGSHVMPKGEAPVALGSVAVIENETEPFMCLNTTHGGSPFQ
jgi:hypothetical protein